MSAFPSPDEFTDFDPWSSIPGIPSPDSTPSQSIPFISHFPLDAHEPSNQEPERERIFYYGTVPDDIEEYIVHGKPDPSQHPFRTDDDFDPDEENCKEHRKLVDDLKNRKPR